MSLSPANSNIAMDLSPPLECAECSGSGTCTHCPIPKSSAGETSQLSIEASANATTMKDLFSELMQQQQQALAAQQASFMAALQTLTPGPAKPVVSRDQATR